MVKEIKIKGVRTNSEAISLIAYPEIHSGKAEDYKKDAEKIIKFLKTAIPYRTYELIRDYFIKENEKRNS